MLLATLPGATFRSMRARVLGLSLTAVLSLAEIKDMVQAMFNQNRDYLPQFNCINVERETLQVG